MFQFLYLCSICIGRFSLNGCTNIVVLKSELKGLYKSIKYYLIQFLGQEDLLEKGKTTHASVLGLP